MAKIIPFRLPDRTAGGHVGHKTPVKPKPAAPAKPQKQPIIISVMPEQAFPAGHRDLRPLLQRDGLILMSWAVWEDWYGDESLLRRYVVNWVTSRGKTRRCATKAVEEKDLASAVPERKGDPLFYRGAYGTVYANDMHYYTEQEIADYLYLVAPFDLGQKTIPSFIGVLKALGSTVNFDIAYSLTKERAKRNEAQKYLEKLTAPQEA